MKRLNSELKRILAGLAFQDAGEFLSTSDKMQRLGYVAEFTPQSPAPRHKAAGPVTRRIALISDGRGLGAPLDYAIESSLRQAAQIDLLLHGAIEAERIAALEQRVRQAGVESVRIQLGGNAVDDIANYISNHPALIFLVALPDDTAAMTLMEEVIPKRGGRIPVPLVLIEGQSLAGNHKQSAA